MDFMKIARDVSENSDGMTSLRELDLSVSEFRRCNQ